CGRATVDWRANVFRGKRILYRRKCGFASSTSLLAEQLFRAPFPPHLSAPLGSLSGHHCILPGRQSMAHDVRRMRATAQSRGAAVDHLAGERDGDGKLAGEIRWPGTAVPNGQYLDVVLRGTVLLRHGAVARDF